MNSVEGLLRILQKHGKINYMRLKKEIQELSREGKLDYSFEGLHSEELEDILRFLDSYGVVRFDGSTVELTRFGLELLNEIDSSITVEETEVNGK